MTNSPNIRFALLAGGSNLQTGEGTILHPKEAPLLSPRAVPKRRNDFLRGRVVARRLLTDALPLDAADAAEIAILPDRDGVPWIEHDNLGRLPYSLSISHTTGFAAAAFVDLPWRIGVDVEHPIESPTAIVQDYFECGEKILCERAGEDEVSLRAGEIWALKEAGLKALGKGLRIPASSIVVQRIGTTADPNGWQRVDMKLGATAPDANQFIVGWVQRDQGILIALSVLSADRLAPVPASPRPFRFRF